MIIRAFFERSTPSWPPNVHHNTWYVDGFIFWDINARVCVQFLHFWRDFLRLHIIKSLLQNPILSKRRKLVQKEAAESEIRDAKARIAANNKVLKRRRMQNKDIAKPGQSQHFLLHAVAHDVLCCHWCRCLHGRPRARSTQNCYPWWWVA